MRTINEIIIHCSATPEGREVSVAEIDSWHRQRGFNSIGYHYVIYLDGTVAKGRDEQTIGAHCSGHNAHSIGVCYVGGCDKSMRPKDTRTPSQRQALIDLLHQLQLRYPNAKIYGHNELTCTRPKSVQSNCNHQCTACRYTAKACPSFNVPAEL